MAGLTGGAQIQMQERKRARIVDGNPGLLRPHELLTEQVSDARRALPRLIRRDRLRKIAASSCVCRQNAIVAPCDLKRSDFYYSCGSSAISMSSIAMSPWSICPSSSDCRSGKVSAHVQREILPRAVRDGVIAREHSRKVPALTARLLARAGDRARVAASAPPSRSASS
jgi:hypothetical protein